MKNPLANLNLQNSPLSQPSKEPGRLSREPATPTTSALARKTRRAFLLVLFTPLLLGIAVVWEIRSYQESVAWVSHTKDVLGANNRLLLAVTKAESAKRGFLLTGDELFIQRLTAAEADARGQLEALSELTVDNSNQQLHLDHLQSAVVRQFAAFEKLIQLRRQRALNSQEYDLYLSQGSGLTTEVSNNLRKVADTEETLLQQRTRAEQATAVGVGSSFALCILVNLGVLVWAYRLITRYARARELAAEQILELNSGLEARVAERTFELESVNEQLRRSNADLTKFAYIASHDLQEPLRTIGSYVGLISHRYQGKLDDQADKYIKFVVDGAKRMQNLVQDLLQYSRVGTEPLNLTSVNMNDLVQNVRNSLEYTINEQRASIVNGRLPVLKGDETKLTQVVTNLITNAMKFRKPNEVPVLELQAVREGSEWLFTLKDNGIGFEQQYSERIFAIFQRLHGVGVYPGTGMGLAICKRVIELHGGRIWATSDGVSGSVFSFTLPAISAERPSGRQLYPSSDKMKEQVVPR